MRSQIEKGKEILCDEIEKLGNEKMTDAVAAKLNTYHGAYKALCMLENGEEYTNNAAAMVQSEEKDEKQEKAPKKSSRTMELDGDTEFEKILMGIPIDAEHVTAVFNVFADHMESLSVMNRRAYENVMMRLREVARA